MPHATHEFPAHGPGVETYREELAWHDIDQHLWIPLPSSDGHPTVVGACRPADRYTAQELGLAATVQPLLQSLVRHARVIAGCPATSAAVDELHLTAREVAVLALCAEGRTTASSARRLGISPRTVHKHLENAYRKMGVRDRLSAVLRAHAVGVLELPADGDRSHRGP